MNVRNAIDRALMGSRWINRSFERHHNEGRELHLRHLRAMAVNLISNIDELILQEEAATLAAFEALSRIDEKE